MRARKFLMMRKAIATAGEWKHGSQSKMGKKSFPVRKSGYILGVQWNWRVDSLDCAGTPGRILIAFHHEKQSYLAWLAIERQPGVLTLVARLEYHGDHTGWHMHTKCADLDDFDAQVVRQRNQGIRIPDAGGYHRDSRYEMGHQEATNRAYRAFRIGSSEGGLFE